MIYSIKTKPVSMNLFIYYKNIQNNNYFVCFLFGTAYRFLYLCFFVRWSVLFYIYIGNFFNFLPVFLYNG